MDSERDETGTSAARLRFDVEGRGYAVGDYESQYFVLVDEPEHDTRYLSAACLAERAGLVVLHGDEERAALYGVASPRDGVVSAFAADALAGMQARTGRAHPPLYRLRVTVEAVPVPDAEAEAYWRAERERDEAECRDAAAPTDDAPGSGA
jgi:hypothetical protein